MSVESEACVEVFEQKLSPSLMSDLSTDGDTSTNQNNSSSNEKFSQLSINNENANSEPKAKKRRKQSNPLKIQNDAFPKFDLSYDLPESSDVVANASTGSYFVNEELLNQSQDIDRKASDLSQKGSLSKVTNALYNKIKESAKANKTANKSKESSLSSCPSVTDVSSPDSSEDLGTNAEYKLSLQNPYSPMPPLLPLNPIEVSEAAKVPVNPYQFPDFSSPAIPQGNNNLSITHRSFITSSGVRVFNPEAYCELCEKEFCNKYFLKTHKANKHGICSMDTSSSYSNYRQYKSSPVTPQSTQQMINQVCENGATFGSADSYCNICQKYFCNKYFLKKHRQNIHGIHENLDASPLTPSSIHVPVISSPLPIVRSSIIDIKPVDISSGLSTKDEDSKLNISLENIKNSLNSSVSLLNGSSPHPSSQIKTNNDSKEEKSEKYLCELCNIEFCDKGFLDAHKKNKHGLARVADSPDEGIKSNDKANSPASGDDSKDLKEQICAPCMKSFPTPEAFQSHMLEVHMLNCSDLINSDKPTLMEMDNSNGSTDSAPFSCIICQFRCKDRNSFVAHMASEHAGSDFMVNSIVSCDLCAEQFSDRLTLMAHKYKKHGIKLHGFDEYVENGDVSYHASRPKNNSSFCTICNKELCNKYFMKTHMLKMHGIGIDKNAQQDRWSASQGNSMAGVHCDICQKYLSSKYFLKVHKQNVHGIIDDSLKHIVAGINNNSGVNMKKFEKIYENAGMVNNVGNDIMLVQDRQKGKIFSCDLCGHEFPNKLALQVHLVDKHVRSNDAKNSLALPNSYSQMPEETRESSRVLPCSCCLLVNLGDNLQAEIGQELKLVSCIVCNITYQQSDYHSHHLGHQSNPNAKKLLENGHHQPDINPSGNNTLDPEDKGKMMPRKFKRFRCSKCDKTFRTKKKCMQHIQLVHKNKRPVPNPYEQQVSPKKSLLNHLLPKKNSDTRPSMENGSALISDQEAKQAASILSSGAQEGEALPVPYVLPKNSDVIMQPFHLSEPKPDGAAKQDVFVPSLVYLPVSQRVSEPVTVAFTLTPA